MRTLFLKVAALLLRLLCPTREDARPVVSAVQFLVLVRTRGMLPSSVRRPRVGRGVRPRLATTAYATQQNVSL